MSSTVPGGFFVCLLVAAVVDFFSASEGVDKLWVLATDGVTGDEAAAETGDGVKLVFGRILDLVVVFVGATETVESPVGSGWRFVVVVDEAVALDGAAEDKVAAEEGCTAA